MGDLLSYANYLIADHPQGIAVEGSKPPMNYRIAPFAGGSDHVPFNDPFFGVPSCMFGHKDPYYHTSFDTLEMCDPTQLQRCMAIALTCGYILADLDEFWIESILPGLSTYQYARLGKIRHLLQKVQESSDFSTDKKKYEFGKALLDARKEHEILALEKLVPICNITDKIGTITDQLQKEISQWYDLQLAQWTAVFKDKEICNTSSEPDSPIEWNKHYDGPFDYYKIPGYESEPVYKDYNSLAKSTGFGELFLETLFLFEENQSFEKTAAFNSAVCSVRYL